MTTTITPNNRPRGAHLKNGQPPPSRIMQAIKGIAVAAICFIIVMPFVGIISTSIAPRAQLSAAGGFVFFPQGIDLTAYRAILSGGVVTRSLQISVLVTVVGTLLALTATALLAYALSRRNMPFRGFALGMVLLTLLFQPGMIPMYLAVKDFGMLNTLWALIVPSMISGFNVIVMRAFFMNVPGELTDAARIDGASEMQTFAHIMLPLSKAVLAVIGLFYAVSYWNSFFAALLYIGDSALWPMQLVLRTYVVNSTTMAKSDLNVDVVPPEEQIQMAVLVLAVLPILIVYPFLQKHFAKGVLTGAVKG